MSNQIKGIDVSQHQGKINWAKVKDDGVNFAMIRVGCCGYDGNIILDKTYHTNMQGAIAYGIDVGVYVYSYAKTPTVAKLAAEQTLNLIKQYNITYPVAFDIENKVNCIMSKLQNNAIIKAFLGVIENAKYYGVIYTYTNFASCYLDMTQLTQYDVWIADYRGFNGYNGKYGMWQHSSKGRVNGISGNVDMNIAYKDYPNLIKNAGLNKSQAKPVAPTPAPKPQLPPPNYKNYVVKHGDSFWRIAQQQMGSWTKMYKLASFNGLKLTSTITPGQILKLPK